MPHFSSEVEARATISTGNEWSYNDLPEKVFSPKCKDNNSSLYTGLKVNYFKTVIRNLP